MFTRSMPLKIREDGQDKTISFLGSTPDPVDMGGWREVLEHGDGCVDTSTATALLVNHDPNRIAGAIRGCDVKPSGAEVRSELIDGAMMDSQIKVADAVRCGALRGISAGYTYAREDADWNQETRTLRVRKWRLLEMSLTPIPADPRASLRSIPFDLDKTHPHPTAPVAANHKERHMADPAAPTADDLAKIKAENDKLQAANVRLANENKIRSVASEHGISVDGLDFAKSESECLTELLKRKAGGERAVPNSQPKPGVQVVVDGADKWIEGAGKGLRGERDGIVMPSLELVRRCAKFDGVDLADASPMEIASYAVRRMSYSKRDAANKINSSFSVLTGSTANRQLLNGFDAYAAVWAQICTIKDAADFNAHYHVAAASGRLIETPENEAYPELIQKEGSYSSTLKKFGATISITMEALVNDQLGEIMRSFYRTGYIAGRTIDREVFYRLLNAAWTNDTTTSAGLGTAGNLDKVRADLKKKLMPSGEKLEADPAVVIVDPVNRYNADLATGQIYKVDSMVAQGSTKVAGLRTVDSTFVGDTGLLAGALTTTYFLAADPLVVDTVTLEFLRGQRTPEITPFDPGAVDAVKMKVALPFVATVATHTDSAGNARVTGIQKATA